MAGLCTLTVNGKRVEARSGMTLVDAALRGGIVIPTDCASGQCETCRVTLVSGGAALDRPETGNAVLACQARLSGDAEIRFDDVPVPSRASGSVALVGSLAPDILEVAIDLEEALHWLPGQYVKLAFRGYPSRDYSPTVSLLDTSRPHRLVFHVKVHPNGAVSSALGAIRSGHRVVVEGPFGNAFHRRGSTRLVLVGTGTGWAPLWAIASAARREEPGRPMKVVVGARRPQGLYMRESLNWLRRTGVSDVVLSCSGIREGDEPGLIPGRTTDHLGALGPEDTVYAAGAPSMVEAVKAIASAAGAQCYADPFTTSTAGRSFLGRLQQAIETADPARLRPRHDLRPQTAPRPPGTGRADRVGGAEGSRRLTGLARWFQSR